MKVLDSSTFPFTRPIAQTAIVHTGLDRSAQFQVQQRGIAANAR